MDRIIFFGIGREYKKIRNSIDFDFKKVEIVALIDNDEAKQGGIVDGVQIYSPLEALKYCFDYIVVCGIYAGEMKKQLLDCGVDDKKIATLFDLGRFPHWFKRKELNIFCDEKNLSNALIGQKRHPIVLFNYLKYAGGPLALLRMAQILKDNGFDIVLVADEMGPALKEYTDLNIPVVIDSNIKIGVIRRDTWLSNASMIVLNGIPFTPLIANLPSKIPVVWWLHDPEEYYLRSGFDFENLSLKNIDIYAVSDFAWNPLKKRFPYLQKQLLRYGLPAAQSYANTGRFNGKLIFAALGRVHKIKGQDIFLEAVSHMSEEKRKQCEFWIIGNTDNSFADELRRKAEVYPEFVFMGEYDQEGINKLYEQISVVVTPSRADMLPTVNVEAMMRGIPCIITENAGTANLINDGVDGLIVKGNDPKDLAIKMEWMIENRSKLGQMGEKSRIIYEKNFTMEIFEQNILKIINKNLNFKNDA